MSTGHFSLKVSEILELLISQTQAITNVTVKVRCCSYDNQM